MIEGERESERNREREREIGRARKREDKMIDSEMNRARVRFWVLRIL